MTNDFNLGLELNTVEVKDVKVQCDPIRMCYYITLTFQTPAKERTVRIKLNDEQIYQIMFLLKRIKI